MVSGAIRIEMIGLTSVRKDWPEIYRRWWFKDNPLAMWMGPFEQAGKWLVR